MPQENDGKENEIEPSLSLKIAFSCGYRAAKTAALRPGWVEEFQRTIAAAQLWPFLRAHVADLTWRAGLPALFLPLAHLPSPPARKPATRGRRRAQVP